MSEDRPFVYEPDNSLSTVNSTLRDEFLHFAWVRMRSRFFEPKLFTLATEAQPGTVVAYQYLSKVELSFTNKEWFTFFGVNMDRHPFGINTGWAQSQGSYLRKLESLRDLRLRYRTPDDGYQGSQWGSEYEHDRFCRYGGEDYICCQRTMVDWICTFAYPFLIDKCKKKESKEKLTVTLTGAVKTVTKEKWEAIFKGQRDHDQEAALEAIFNTSDEEL